MGKPWHWCLGVGDNHFRVASFFYEVLEVVMNLHPEWKRIIKKAWSIRWILLAGFFSGLEALLAVVTGFGVTLPIRPGVLAILSFFAANFAFVTRLLAQKELKGNQDDDQAGE